MVIGADDWSAGGAGLVRRAARGRCLGRARPPVRHRAPGGRDYRAYPDLPPAESQFDIGLTGDPKAARDWSEETATALKSAGFDLNLGPLADVAGPASPIADRSFSDDPELATTLVGRRGPGLRGHRRRLCRPALPRARRRLGRHRREPGDGQPRPRLARGPRPGRVPRGLRRRGAGDRPLPRLLHGLRPDHPGRRSPPRSRPTCSASELGFEGLAISDDLSAGAIAGRSRRTRGRGAGDRGGNRPRDGRRPGSGGPGPHGDRQGDCRTAASRSSAWTKPSRASSS